MCNETYYAIQFSNKIQNQKIATTCYRPSQSFLETITLKTLLNSDVKRRELINFTNYSPEAHIRVAYFYSPLLGTNAIISNCV